MTAWIIVGCILLFFIILFAVRFNLTIDLAEELKLTLQWLFIKIMILPKKEKTYDPRDYTLKKIRQREEREAQEEERKKKKDRERAKKKAERQAELDAMSEEERREEKRKKKESRPPLTEFIPLVLRILGMFCSKFFGKLRIKIARLNIRVGSSDVMQTAVLYGIVNQSVAYLMEGLNKFTHVDGLDKAEINITPDFLSDKIDFDCNMTFRLSLGQLLGALIKAGWNFLVGYIRIKPKKGASKRPPAPPKAPTPPTPPTPPPVPKPEERA